MPARRAQGGRAARMGSRAGWHPAAPPLLASPPSALASFTPPLSAPFPHPLFFATFPFSGPLPHLIAPPGSPGGTRTTPALRGRPHLHPCAPPPSPLFCFISTSQRKEKMLELGQDWYLEPLQLTAPFSHRERRPPRRTAGARRLAPRRWGLKSSRPPFGFGQERRLQTRQPLPGWSPLEKS